MRDTRQQELARHGDLISPYNGRVLSQAEVDAYNRYTLDFNRFTYEADKEFMLDQRHRFVVACFYEEVAA
jgi:hypothetical protein